MSRTLVLASILLWLATLGFATAQDGAESKKEVSPPSQRSIKQEQPPEVVIANLRKAFEELQSENERLRSNAGQAELSYYEYYYNNYLRRRAELQLKGYQWQRRTSEILVWVVVAMSLAGVLFSAYQLWRASLPVQRIQVGDTGGADLQTTVEMSMQHLKVTSSVVGLIVLVISVAYLYLFLVEVYRITVIDDIGPGTQAKSSADAAKGRQQ